MNNQDKITRLYKSYIFPWLRQATRKNNEVAHDLTLTLLRLTVATPFAASIIEKHIRVSDPRLQRTLFQGKRQITIANPIGLAAGLDKNAVALRAWQMLGLGFVEAGTILPEDQYGNPKPRVIHHDDGIQNAMGFPSDGAPVVGKRIKRVRVNIAVAVSVGKMKDTPIESAPSDYCRALRKLAEASVDFGKIAYIAVNPSSPNTPGLRKLEGKQLLTGLLIAVSDTAYEIARRQGYEDRPAIMAKMSDLTFPAVDDFGEACLEAGADGIIAINTTLDHPYPPFAFGMKGGYSGPDLWKKSFPVVKYIRQHAPDNLTIIGVGGIDRPERVRAMMEEAGANALQTLTGFVREGPMLPRDLCLGLLERM